MVTSCDIVRFLHILVDGNQTKVCSHNSLFLHQYSFCLIISRPFNDFEVFFMMMYITVADWAVFDHFIIQCVTLMDLD